MAKIAKRVQKSREGIDPTKIYGLTEAVSLVKERATAKFDETVEVAMNLGVDPRHADQMVRGVVNLPNGTGRTVRVAVFARGAKADEAKAAGADVVGAEELVEIVQGGKIDFDRCIATPDMMPLVGRLGKVLGPRGMMPNPKVGTVTMDVAGAVKASKGGAVEFRVEKAGIIHAGIGKASFDAKALEENIRAFADAVVKAKPAGAKGNYVKRVAISSTMGGPEDRPGNAQRRLKNFGLRPGKNFRLFGAGNPDLDPELLSEIAGGFTLITSACMRRVRSEFRNDAGGVEIRFEPRLPCVRPGFPGTPRDRILKRYLGSSQDDLW